MNTMYMNTKSLIQKISIFILISFALVSCSDSIDESGIYPSMTMASSDMGSLTEEYSKSMVPSIAPMTSSGESVNSSIKPKIQVNGSLSMEVISLDSTIPKVKNIVSINGGRITSSNSGYSNQPYVNINILIPSSVFDGVLVDIKQLSSIVTNENIYTNDVTEEYIDIESRLNVMLETEKRFIDLLSNAKNVEEIVQVEKEVMRIRGEIDSLKGRMKYLATTTENSELNLYIVEEMPISGGDNWSFSDSLDDSLRNFVSFIKNTADFLIGIIVFAPIMIILGLIALFSYRFIKKRQLKDT